MTFRGIQTEIIKYVQLRQGLRPNCISSLCCIPEYSWITDKMQIFEKGREVTYDTLSKSFEARQDWQS